MSKQAKGILYLVPTPITGPDDEREALHHPMLPALFQTARHYVVEELRTARRFMRKAGYPGDFSEISFFPMGKHARENEFTSYLLPCLEGHDVCLLSEAGMPCVADPGSVVVSMAHSMGIRVVPLSGPSSIIMALAASGLNGQRFEFHGYLPIHDAERRQSLQGISRDALGTGKTHIFIEAPFRNDKMMQAILANVAGDLSLCVAASISTPQEFILTMNVSDWKGRGIKLGKQPVVYLLGQ